MIQQKLLIKLSSLEINIFYVDYPQIIVRILVYLRQLKQRNPSKIIFSLISTRKDNLSRLNKI